MLAERRSSDFEAYFGGEGEEGSSDVEVPAELFTPPAAPLPLQYPHPMANRKIEELSREISTPKKAKSKGRSSAVSSGGRSPRTPAGKWSGRLRKRRGSGDD